MGANPNPARITEASWWFMEQLLALEPDTENSGIFADKPGYHNTRNNLLAQGLSGDYSIQLAADKRGPGDKAAAYDWTFPSAQGGDYSRILVYGRRIEAAFDARDPRLRGWREVLIQADPDQYAEGFDFQDWYRRTPDASHLWHMHGSELREFLESYTTKKAMLSVLKGQTLDEWKEDEGMGMSDVDAAYLTPRVEALAQMLSVIRYGPETGKEVKLVTSLTRVETKLDGLIKAVAAIGTSDPGVAALLAEMHAALDAQAAAIEAEVRDAVADLGEGGASQVRADA